MTTREIQGHLKEIYKVEVSPSLISAVTDAVLDDVKAWQTRPLDAVYPIVYLDAIHVNMRTEGHVQTQAVYLALALSLSGDKELLGLWVAEAEAIASVFPEARVQLCIVHMVRGSLKYVSWKEREVVARALRAIYHASTLEAAE